MSFQDDEKVHLADYARTHWDVDGYVLPQEFAAENLHEDVRESALAYFNRHQIRWWTGRYDLRAATSTPLPTDHLNSSQVACVNHLEPARIDRSVAARVLENLERKMTPCGLEDGFVEYEWIGKRNYLNEVGWGTRGANTTSLDALMCGSTRGTNTIVAIEWKYLETYGSRYEGISDRGTDRTSTYRDLLERKDCPIAVDNIEFLFYDPCYQLMRQTLLAWQMAQHGEFDAHDWVHIHVVPEGNERLRYSQSSPDLEGSGMEEKWKSVLRVPSRYRLITPSDLVASTGETTDWSKWRASLARRYLT